MPMLPRIVTRFAAARRGGPAVEFAISGTLLFGFIMGIINLGLLGLSVGALTRGVEATGRWAAIQAAASYASSGSTVTEPCFSRVTSAFNGFVSPPLPALGTPTSNTITSNGLTLTINWTTTGVGKAPGVYLTLTGTYAWQPLGFHLFGSGFNVNITTAATVLGSSTSGTTMSTTCN